MSTININGLPLEVKEYKGQRVVTFKDIDRVHGRPDGTARKRFNDNRKYFIEGEDFFIVKPADIRMSEIRTSEINNRGTIFLTESGYFMIAKSLTDDLSWSVQRQLINGYFRARELITSYTELLKLYNDINYNIKVLAQKIDALEKKSGEVAGKSVQDTVDTLVPCFYLADMKNDTLEQKINKLEKTSNNIENPSLVFDFINECCERRCGYRNNVTTADLYRAFEKWCLMKNTNAPSKPVFIDQICAYFQTDDKRNIRKNIAGKWYYLITLTPSAMKKLKK